jgi:DNA polymerase V
MNQGNIYIFKLKKSEKALPLFLSTIQCGFPSPADDYLEECLSLDDICISNADSTFLGKVKGQSLKDLNISEGDIAVIDKSLRPQHKDLVVCAIDGEFNAKILNISKTGIVLMSANPDFKPIIIQELNGWDN